MIQSYFFIPANKPKFISKVSSLQADNFIFDMEESVCEADFTTCIDNLKGIEIKPEYWVRIPVDYSCCAKSSALLKELYAIGFRKVVLPKIETAEQLLSFIEVLPHRDIQVGILVESPMALVNFLSIAKAYPKLAVVAIGSHDYCNTVGCKHEEANIVYLRQKLLTECKAFSIPVVDYVSTNFTDLEAYMDECKRANNMGFDGKAIIHPKQLEAFNRVEYYTQVEIAEAESVVKAMEGVDMKDFATLNINGHLYEKPHLKRLYQIYEWNLKRQQYGI